MKSAVLILSCALLAACEAQPAPNPDARQTQAQKAAEAANTISFTENAEIENIKRRLELTSNPGLTGFVLLMNEAGQPIYYSGVAGKITSGSKRLTRPQEKIRSEYGQGYGDMIFDAASDEGTYGSSNEYIYFWTTGGQYIQWNGKYLYSDKPFRTRIEPLVVAVQN